MAFSVRTALAVVALWAMLTLTAANIFEQGSMNKLLAGDATYYGECETTKHQGQLPQQMGQMHPARHSCGTLGSLKFAAGLTQTTAAVLCR
jgi:hypothetical protein